MQPSFVYPGAAQHELRHRAREHGTTSCFETRVHVYRDLLAVVGEAMEPATIGVPVSADRG